MKTISRSCPSAKAISVWSAAQGSSPAPVLPDNRARCKAAGSASEPLRPMNSVRLPLTVRRGFAHLGKDDAAGLGAGVGIPCEEGPAVGILLRHDVHEIRVSPLAEHQLPVPWSDSRLERPDCCGASP